ncbi:hypothetical protein DL98DRAFT_523281 [Cadophora sp. DSE1049]|nr:hypothetical protein DL98DRAFT_523281 [Cadophora sp. DSE1049]
MDLPETVPLSGISPEATGNEYLILATKALRRHLGLAETPGEKSSSSPPSTQPLFWVEVVPPSARGARCQLDCPKNIMPGEYRIAVNPGQHGHYGNRSSDYYHVHCFEKIADFSQADFLDRVQPLTRNLTRLRNLESSSFLDGNYLLDAGAERLSLEWKVTVGGLIDKRDGVESETMDSRHSAFNDLLRKSGSSNYIPQMVPGMSEFEFILLSCTLAPIEGDGSGDSEEWNLFEEYLAVADNHEEDLNNRHSLSETLEAWGHDVVLATSDNLTEKGKKQKEGLSSKAIRAIKRLAVTPMPDIQGAFLRGL